MQYPGMPNSKITELLSTNQRDFSLQELMQIALQLYDDEIMHCCTSLTPTIKLMVSLDNKLSSTEVVQTNLYVLSPTYMRDKLVFMHDTRYLQRARIKGRSRSDPQKLLIQDIIDIFHLEDDSVWHIDSYTYPTSNGGFSLYTVGSPNIGTHENPSIQ